MSHGDTVWDEEEVKKQSRRDLPSKFMFDTVAEFSRKFTLALERTLMDAGITAENACCFQRLSMPAPDSGDYGETCETHERIVHRASGITVADIVVQALSGPSIGFEIEAVVYHRVDARGELIREPRPMG